MTNPDDYVKLCHNCHDVEVQMDLIMHDINQIKKTAKILNERMLVIENLGAHTEYEADMPLAVENTVSDYCNQTLRELRSYVFECCGVRLD